MKNKIGKIACLTLALTCAASSFAACAGTAPGEQIDLTKTQLYVGLVPSGYGNSWLYKAIDRFEAAYADYEFEPGTGKKGAEIIIDDVAYGNTIATSLPTARYEVVYTEDVNYFDLISKGLLYDMSAMLTEEFADTDANGNAITSTIADKIAVDYIEEVYTHNGKMYALPFVANDRGIIYDRDLFEEKGYFFIATDPDSNDYKAYKQSNGSYLFGKESDPDTQLSQGRDGKPGTWDDGLPATYEQFFALFGQMLTDGVTPITWSGMYASYYTYWLTGVWANNEGYDQMLLNYTFDGTANTIVESVDANGNVTLKDPIAITQDNGYELYAQAGRYYALEFGDRVIEEMKKDLKGNAVLFKDSVDQQTAQDNFIKSITRAENNSAKYSRVAMLLEGIHWENEAANTFAAMANDDEKMGRMERKFGWMPFPHYAKEESQINTAPLYLDGSSAMMFVNGTLKSNKVDIATKFVQFMHTRESLVEFSQITSMIQPFKYEINDAEKAKMSYFGQDVYNKFSESIKENGSVKFLEPRATNDLYKKSYTLFSLNSSNNWATLSSKLGNTDVPRDALVTCSAKDYFDGVVARYDKTYWTTNVLGK